MCRTFEYYFVVRTNYCFTIGSVCSVHLPLNCLIYFISCLNEGFLGSVLLLEPIQLICHCCRPLSVVFWHGTEAFEWPKIKLVWLRSVRAVGPLDYLISGGSERPTDLPRKRTSVHVYIVLSVFISDPFSRVGILNLHGICQILDRRKNKCF